MQKHMPLLLRFEFEAEIVCVTHCLPLTSFIQDLQLTRVMPGQPFLHTDWFQTLHTHTHTCITSPQAAAYLSRWPEGDTKNWIDNSRWKEVNPDCISLQVRQLGCKPELFFTPTSTAAAAVARAPSSLLIYTGSRLSLSGWQTLRGSPSSFSFVHFMWVWYWMPMCYSVAGLKATRKCFLAKDLIMTLQSSMWAVICIAEPVPLFPQS